MATPRLVLASTSRFRAELLSRLGVEFDRDAPDFDERAHDHRFGELEPRAFAELLARGKAESLAARHPDAHILAADQLAVLREDGRALLLHKPENADAAVEQLMRLAGREHELITAVVLRGPDAQVQIGFDHHRMLMRRFPRAEAEAYVRKRMPTDSVGAYHIEDEGIALFEAIDGRDFTGIIGLPLLTVAPMLRRAGIFASP